MAQGAGWEHWRGQVAAPEQLGACIAELGILPTRSAEPWPSLVSVCNPSVTAAEAWRWGGSLVAQRNAFCGRALPQSEGFTFLSIPLFSAFFALTAGSDYTRSYTGNAFGMEAKAIADLMMSRGPLTIQQLRQGMRLHKRFMGPLSTAALIELEKALVVVAAGQEMASLWKLPPGGGSLGEVGKPLSKWSRQIGASEVDLRVWDLVLRWAPPEALAAADRLRENRDRARQIIRDAAQALAPTATNADIATFLGWSENDDPWSRDV